MCFNVTLLALNNGSVHEKLVTEQVTLYRDISPCNVVFNGSSHGERQVSFIDVDYAAHSDRTILQHSRGLVSDIKVCFAAHNVMIDPNIAVFVAGNFAADLGREETYNP